MILQIVCRCVFFTKTNVISKAVCRSWIILCSKQTLQLRQTIKFDLESLKSSKQENRRRRAALDAKDIHKESVAHRHSIHSASTEQQFKSLFTQPGQIDGGDVEVNCPLSPARSPVPSTILTPQKREDITNKIMSRVPSTQDVSARDEFFERYQVLGRQRQIASVTAHDDVGALATSLGSYRNTSRRLRSRTLPEKLAESTSAAKDSASKDICDTFLTGAGISSCQPQPLLSPFQSPKKKGMRQGESETPHESAPDTPSLHHSPMRNAMLVAATSPRSVYINGCMREGLNPRASLVLRKKVSKKLSLQHQGMGDKMGRLFAESLRSIALVEAINLSDNNLTDVGLAPMVQAISTIPTLTDLDLSQNTVGLDTAQSLWTFLAQESCPLRRLVLHHAHINDFECEKFINSLKNNNKLKELNISNNRIGKSENLNAVNPETVTGGEALANWLKMPTCVLESLNVSWNVIRMDGAVALSQSLVDNSSLTHLDLSYNALSRDGGVALGSAIIHNTGIKTINLAHNSLDSVACFTICAGLIENRGLKHASFDGNPIGEKGANAMMMVPVVCSARVKLTANQCNITMKDPSCWFRFDKLPGEYELQMKDPFDRAVALMLFHLVAYHHSCVFAKINYTSVATRKTPSSTTPIQLVSSYSFERQQYFDERQKKIALKMEKLLEACRDIKLAISLFHEADTDKSGGICMHELKHLLNSMGIFQNDVRLRETMATYDTGGSGSIDLSDFLKYLATLHLEVEAHYNDLMKIPCMALKQSPDVRYVPPLKGKLTIQVVDGFVVKKIYRTLASCDRQYMNDVASASADSASMSGFGLSASKLRLDDALIVCQSMAKDAKNKSQMIGKLLIQMSTVEHARSLVAHVVDGDKSELMKLKREIGLCLRPMLGVPNGFYFLDLSLEFDRRCVLLLWEISSTLAHERSSASPVGYGLTGDTSQKGNWTSFRNELLNGSPFVVNAAFINELPHTGKLEFDYSGAKRPTATDIALRDAAIVVLFDRLKLLPPDIIKAELLSELKHARDTGYAYLTDPTKANVYECSHQKAQEIGVAMAIFHEHLTDRTDIIGREAVSLTSGSSGGAGSSVSNPPSKAVGLSVCTEDSENRAPNNTDSQTPWKAQRPVESGGSVSKTPYVNLPDIDHTGGLLARSKRRSLFGAAKTVIQNLFPQGKLAADTSIVNSRRAAINQGVHAVPSSGQYTGGGDSQHATVAKAAMPLVAPRTLGTATRTSLHTYDSPQSQKSHSLFHSESDSDVSDDESTHSSTDSSVNSDVEDERILKEGHKQLHKGNEFYGVNVSSQPVASVHLQDIVQLNITPAAKAKRLLETLDEALGYMWIMSRHLALLVECMAKTTFGMVEKCKFFGNYRVELVVMLYGRVVDLYNFDLVLRLLDANETAAVYCRLGCLNLFNPMKAEGAYELDLSRWDERQMVKSLVVLATQEVGENWTEKTFRWGLDVAPVPGWTLTQPWITDDGLPQHGILDVTYFSGQGTKKGGCVPNIKSRKALLHMVLLNENDFVTDEVRMNPPTLLTSAGPIDTFTVGAKLIKQSMDLWQKYLSHDSKTAAIKPVSVAKKISKKRSDFIEKGVLPGVLTAMEQFEGEKLEKAGTNNTAGSSVSNRTTARSTNGGKEVGPVVSSRIKAPPAGSLIKERVSSGNKKVKSSRRASAVNNNATVSNSSSRRSSTNNKIHKEQVNTKPMKGRPID